MRRKKKVHSKSNFSKNFIIFCIALQFILVILGFGLKHFGLNVFNLHSKPIIEAFDISNIKSSNGILVDVTSGYILGSKNPDEIIYPASITKVMTAILAIEKGQSLDKTISLDNRVFDDLAGSDAITVGYTLGEIVKIKDLLYGCLLHSGAECTNALAIETAGSIPEFIDMMNSKAKELDLNSTHFTNCIGLHNSNHYSSCKDLAKLLKYAIKNKTFREIISTPMYKTSATNVHPEGITIYSSMLSKIDNPILSEGKIQGGKTGFTNQAGLCLASFATIKKHDIVLVTCNAPSNTGLPLHVYDAFNVYSALSNTITNNK